MENKEFQDLEVRDEVLDLARNEMKKNILKRKKIAAVRKVSFRVGIVIILLVALILPITLRSLQGESTPTNNTWFASPSSPNIDYSALKKETISSIDSINKKDKQSFNWLKEGNRIETIQYIYEKDVVMIEETYTYEEVSVTLYVMNNKSVFYNFEMTSIEYKSNNERKLSIASDDRNCYALFYDVYKYYVKIDTTNQETMFHIVDLLRS